MNRLVGFPARVQLVDGSGVPTPSTAQWMTRLQQVVNFPVSDSFPATATSMGVAGQIATDGNYVYVCTATNTWKRAALVTF